MSRKILVRIMIMLCIVYGATMGILSMFASNAIGVFSIVGAMVLALGWVATGMFGRRQETD